MIMIILNLGCGYRQLDNCINIDNRQEVKPDLICDISEGLPFKENEIDKIIANDILEHIPIGKTVGLIEEIYRVLKPNGLFESMTPSTDGRGSFQDPTHVSFWNINSWLYFCDDAHRKLYGIKAKFKGEMRDIITSHEMRIIHTHCNLIAVKG